MLPRQDSSPLTFGSFLFAVASLLISYSPTDGFAKPLPDPWRDVKNPTAGLAESIGEYSAGCLRGAQTLPPNGKGFQLMHPLRKRYFSHPVLIDFIQDLAKETLSQTGQDILIGDMGQARGGPTLSGHASHQTGLDVDIWYWQPAKGKILTPSERENLSAPSMVVLDFEGLSRVWNPNSLVLLKSSALRKQVERIFVNPVIKAEACKIFANQDWLKKLRPWWFHHDHFHVRLSCQIGSPDCISQEPIPPGDGCGNELGSWFTPESKAKAKYLREHPVPPVMPTLPQRCDLVLKE